MRVECLRTLDRLRLTAGFPEEDLATARAAALTLLDAINLVELSPEILDRAEEQFPTLLATLDALHLATALLWQKSEGRVLDAFLTHDPALGRAARAMGMTVLGCAEEHAR